MYFPKNKGIDLKKLFILIRFEQSLTPRPPLSKIRHWVHWISYVNILTSNLSVVVFRVNNDEIHYGGDDTQCNDVTAIISAISTVSAIHAHAVWVIHVSVCFCFTFYFVRRDPASALRNRRAELLRTFARACTRHRTSVCWAIVLFVVYWTRTWTPPLEQARAGTHARARQIDVYT